MSCLPSFLSNITNPLSNWRRAGEVLQLAFTGAERIQEMFDAEEEIRPQNAPVFNELKEGVEIRNVDFSYLPGKPILKDVSISAPKGKMIAVVGPTGSGKTTIMNLIIVFMMWMQVASALMEQIFASLI